MPQTAWSRHRPARAAFAAAPSLFSRVLCLALCCGALLCSARRSYATLGWWGGGSYELAGHVAPDNNNSNGITFNGQALPGTGIDLGSTTSTNTATQGYVASLDVTVTGTSFGRGAS